MQALYIFKLFCFIFASLMAFNLYIELRLPDHSIWQVMVYGGLMMILIEFSFSSRLAAQCSSSHLNNKNHTDSTPVKTPPPSRLYSDILLKIGLISTLSGLLAQSVIN